MHLLKPIFRTTHAKDYETVNHRTPTQTTRLKRLVWLVYGTGQINNLITLPPSKVLSKNILIHYIFSIIYALQFYFQVHRRTLNPVFNETFVFKNIPYSEITNRVLLLELFDFDRFSRHDLIGEARLPLIDVDLASNINEWRVLTPPHSSRSGVSKEGWLMSGTPIGGN